MQCAKCGRKPTEIDEYRDCWEDYGALRIGDNIKDSFPASEKLKQQLLEQVS